MGFFRSRLRGTPGRAGQLPRWGLRILSDANGIPMDLEGTSFTIRALPETVIALDLGDVALLIQIGEGTATTRYLATRASHVGRVGIPELLKRCFNADTKLCKAIRHQSPERLPGFKADHDAFSAPARFHGSETNGSGTPIPCAKRQRFGTVSSSDDDDRVFSNNPDCFERLTEWLEENGEAETDDGTQDSLTRIAETSNA